MSEILTLPEVDMAPAMPEAQIAEAAGRLVAGAEALLARTTTEQITVLEEVARTPEPRMGRKGKENTQDNDDYVDCQVNGGVIQRDA